MSKKPTYQGLEQGTALPEAKTKNYKQLENDPAHLEEMVKKRTSELSAANVQIEHEIQERALMDAELKQANQYLENVLDSSADGIGLVDRNWNFIKWNAAAVSLYGYSQEEIRTKSPFDLYPDKNELEKMLHKLRSDGFVKGYEMDMITKNGRILPFEISIAMLKNKSGEDIGSVCVARDLSDLKKALVQAEAANRAKSEFLTNLSHEIRTPMNAVIGFTELLDSLITDKKQKNYIEAIKSGSTGLLTIINDILDLSMIEAGKLKLQYEPVNPRMIFDEIRNIFSMKLSRKGLDFFVEINPELPEYLMMDEVRLRQVLLNLVGNAIKFTDQGFVKLSIQQTPVVQTDDGHGMLDIQISVEDSGIGIPVGEHDCIFEAFTQQDGQNTKKFGGTGLGLAICKRLVEMLKGDISVVSDKNKGSCFKINFHNIRIAEVSRIRSHIEPDPAQIEFKPATVLAVDDVKSNLGLIREYLKPTQLNVIGAEDGEQALLFAKEYKPDLILMDISMPVMDGYEATRLIKADDTLNHIPIIAISAVFLQGGSKKLKQEGFQGYLCKPITRKTLFNIISGFLKHSTPDLPMGKQVEFLKPKALKMLPVLIETLEKKFMPAWKLLEKRLSIPAVKRFASVMNRLGATAGDPPLEEFANDLFTHAGDFDIENTRKLLFEFPKLVENFKSAQKQYRPDETKINRQEKTPALDICAEDMGELDDLFKEDMDKKNTSSVLIVDDNPKHIHLIGKTLAGKGYMLEAATSGKQALEWVETRRFDLILLDVVMPGMNGFDVCKKLKLLPGFKDTPVILLTVKTEISDIVKGFQIGVVDYVTKPFNPIELMARVGTQLELKSSRDLLRQMALTDGLTKLYNHGYIHERLAQEISRSRREKQPVSVIMFDLDHFKNINDTYGHKIGDEILVMIASLIKELLRKEDVAGRYGGEEFLIILPNTDGQGAVIVANKIKTKIQNHTFPQKGLSVTISGGVCSFEGEDANNLIMKADQLLYQAKEKGRNRIEADC
ncbi:MAG: diguanylate cyclase [Proteobacteria bacterium]|nr:diguanylate cyclase [Pseudomonadota bacterium]MBU1583351.1 diguanylate cyclase [Pseudomonadota bacterium]